MKPTPTASRFPMKLPSLGFLKGRGPGFAFAQDIVAELKRVTWPTRRDANNLTRVVILVSVAVGLMLGLVDMIFYWIINGLILR